MTSDITNADELLNAGDIGRCELIRGELVMVTPAGGEHGRITMEIGARIAVHARERNLGVVYAAETGFVIETDPDTVRAPDCAFIAKDRVPPRAKRGFVRVVPDLVVETVSPDDTASAVLDKVQQWLGAGCRLVWVVEPETRTVTVCRPGGAARVLPEDESLDGEDVLPGFSLHVDALFGPA